MKLCVICNQEKPESEFYKGSGRKCKECFKKIQRDFRKRNIEHYREYDRNRPNKAERKEAHKAYLRKLKETDHKKFADVTYRRANKWRKEHQQKQKAWEKLNDAIRYGKIERPKFCSKCKGEEKIEAHHFDYSKPLDVIWLCSSCHHKLHEEERKSKR